jgi:hypothetical protein
MITKTKKPYQKTSYNKNSEPKPVTNADRLNTATYNHVVAALAKTRNSFSGSLDEMTLAEVTKVAKRVGVYQDARIAAVKEWREDNTEKGANKA